MSYEISIMQTAERKQMIGKCWVPLTKKGDDTIYGYAPEVETVIRESVQIYTQTVDELDLKTVIWAVNGGCKAKWIVDP